MITDRLLVFATQGNRAWAKLEKVIDELHLPDEPQICHSVDELRKELINRNGQTIVALFVVRSGEELEEIAAIKSYLDDVRIILILPDHDEETSAKGFALHPRFMSYVDFDFMEISAVLGKILTIEETRVHGS